MENLKISVITPTFNSADTIKETIESVLSQTYGNVEHVIVDGKSTDNTVEIIRQNEPRYKGRLRWISEPDGGLYDAMNKGIRMASGDVVGVLNSDDFFTSSEVLSAVASVLPGYDAVYGDVHYISKNNSSKCVRYYSSRKFKPWTIKMGLMPAHPSFYCFKTLYNRLGYYDTCFKVAADFELMMRFIYFNAIHTKYIEKDFVTMRMGGASTSGLKSHIRILKEHKEIFRKHNLRYNPLLISIRYIYKILELGGQIKNTRNK